MQCFEQWERKGKGRENLVSIFQSCGYDQAGFGYVFFGVCLEWQASFIEELELLKEDSIEDDLVIEGQFMSEPCEPSGASMSNSFSCFPLPSQPRARITAIKKACKMDPKRLCRWDRYERIMLYWAETAIKANRK